MHLQTLRSPISFLGSSIKNPNLVWMLVLILLPLSSFSLFGQDLKPAGGNANLASNLSENGGTRPPGVGDEGFSSDTRRASSQRPSYEGMLKGEGHRSAGRRGYRNPSGGNAGLPEMGGEPRDIRYHDQTRGADSRDSRRESNVGNGENRGAEQTTLSVDDFFKAMRNGAIPDINNPDQLKLFQFYIMQKFLDPSQIDNWAKDIETMVSILNQNPELAKERLAEHEVTIDLERFERSQEASKIFAQARELYAKLLDPDDGYWKKLANGNSKEVELSTRFWVQVYAAMIPDADMEKLEEIMDWAKRVDAGLASRGEAPQAWDNIRSQIKGAKDSERASAVLRAIARTLKDYGSTYSNKPSIVEAILYDLCAVSGLASLERMTLYSSADGRRQIEILEQMLPDEAKEFREELGLVNVERKEESSIDLAKIKTRFKEAKNGLTAAKKITRRFTVRSLSTVEAPYRSALGLDCSSRTYFSFALSPNLHYFTTTGEEGNSSGHVTVVMGTADSDEGKVKVALVDKIQNIDTKELPAILEAVRRAMAKKGYLLGITVKESMSMGNNGLSNDGNIKLYVRDKLPSFTGSARRVRAFKPHETGHNFPFRFSQAYNGFDLQLVTEYVPPQGELKTSIVEKSPEDAQDIRNVKLEDVLIETYKLKTGNDADNIRYVEIAKSFEALENMAHLVEAGAADHIFEMYSKGSQKVRKEALCYFLANPLHDAYVTRAFEFAPHNFINSIQNFIQTPKLRRYALPWVVANAQMLVDAFLSEDQRSRKWLKSILSGNEKYMGRVSYYELVSALVWDTDFMDRNIERQRLENFVQYAGLKGKIEGEVTAQKIAVACALSNNSWSEPASFLNSTKNQIISILASPLGENPPARIRYLYLFGERAAETAGRITLEAFKVSQGRGSELLGFFEGQRPLWSEASRTEVCGYILFNGQDLISIPRGVRDKLEREFLNASLENRIRALSSRRQFRNSTDLPVLERMLLSTPQKTQEHLALIDAIERNFSEEASRERQGLAALRIKLGDSGPVLRLKDIPKEGHVDVYHRGERNQFYEFSRYYGIDHLYHSFPSNDVYKFGELPFYITNSKDIDEQSIKILKEAFRHSTFNSPFSAMEETEKRIARKLEETFERDGKLSIKTMHEIFEEAIRSLPQDYNLFGSMRLRGETPPWDLGRKLAGAYRKHILNIRDAVVRSHFEKRADAVISLLRVSQSLTEGERLEAGKIIGQASAELQSDAKTYEYIGQGEIAEKGLEILAKWAREGTMPVLSIPYGIEQKLSEPVQLEGTVLSEAMREFSQRGGTTSLARNLPEGGGTRPPGVGDEGFSGGARHRSAQRPSYEGMLGGDTHPAGRRGRANPVASRDGSMTGGDGSGLGQRHYREGTGGEELCSTEERAMEIAKRDYRLGSSLRVKMTEGREMLFHPDGKSVVLYGPKEYQPKKRLPAETGIRIGEIKGDNIEWQGGAFRVTDLNEREIFTDAKDNGGFFPKDWINSPDGAREAGLIVDLGTGKGTLVKWLVKQGYTDVLGIDAYLTEAQEKSPRFRLGLLESLNSLENSSISLAISLRGPYAEGIDRIDAHIIEKYMRPLFHTLHKKLKPGGRVILSGQCYPDKIIELAESFGFQVNRTASPLRMEEIERAAFVGEETLKPYMYLEILRLDNGQKASAYRRQYSQEHLINRAVDIGEMMKLANAGLKLKMSGPLTLTTEVSEKSGTIITLEIKQNGEGFRVVMSEAQIGEDGSLFVQPRKIDEKEFSRRSLESRFLNGFGFILDGARLSPVNQAESSKPQPPKPEGGSIEPPDIMGGLNYEQREALGVIDPNKRESGRVSASEGAGEVAEEIGRGVRDRAAPMSDRGVVEGLIRESSEEAQRVGAGAQRTGEGLETSPQVRGSDGKPGAQVRASNAVAEMSLLHEISLQEMMDTARLRAKRPAPIIQSARSYGTYMFGQLSSELFWDLHDKNYGRVGEAVRYSLGMENLAQYHLFVGVMAVENKIIARAWPAQLGMTNTALPPRYVIRRYAAQHGLAMAGAMWLSGFIQTAMQTGRLEAAAEQYLTAQSGIQVGVSATGFGLARMPIHMWRYNWDMLAGTQESRLARRGGAHMAEEAARWGRFARGLGVVEEASVSRRVAQGLGLVSNLRHMLHFAETNPVSIVPALAIEAFVFIASHGMTKVVMPLIEEKEAKINLEKAMNEVGYRIYEPGLGESGLKQALMDLTETVDAYERVTIWRKLLETTARDARDRMVLANAGLIAEARAKDEGFDYAIREKLNDPLNPFKQVFGNDGYKAIVKSFELMNEADVIFEETIKNNGPYPIALYGDGSEILDDVGEGSKDVDREVHIVCPGAQGYGELKGGISASKVEGNAGPISFDKMDMGYGAKRGALYQEILWCHIEKRLDEADNKAYGHIVSPYIKGMGYEIEAMRGEVKRYVEAYSRRGTLALPDTAFGARIFHRALMGLYLEEAESVCKIQEERKSGSCNPRVADIVRNWSDAAVSMKMAQEDAYKAFLNGEFSLNSDHGISPASLLLYGDGD